MSTVRRKLYVATVWLCAGWLVLAIVGPVRFNLWHSKGDTEMAWWWIGAGLLPGLVLLAVGGMVRKRRG